MPFYDYHCTNCDQPFEARHGFNDPAPNCPHCGSEQVQRQINRSPAFAKGVLAHAGTSRRSSKEELQGKWAEETPKLRKQLERKLGEDVVRKNAPTLYGNSE
ncbi:MAG: FmdB family zinc ribbon protein [Phototrophicaceae bacterium]|jgi:putative FmdB family regulatory protein